VKQFGIFETFIGIYDNAISKKECDIIISQFEKSTQVEGKIYDPDGENVVNYSYKKSIELPSPRLSKGGVISRIINERLIKCIDDYKKEYSSMDNFISPWAVDDGYNLQKYETEEDGFKIWHTEAGVGSTSKRVLAWMFYINDAKSGTEFMHFPTINARMGRCVIWPAGWTHMHRGVCPNKGLKYIATGWASYID
tara:strand:- start:633 stop:1217 length:585 start_codon:yes stop_codon:yes gene_type:complete